MSWQKQRTNKGAAKTEKNIRAAKALLSALGVKSNPKPANWTVCHIWGYDDPKFVGQSGIVQDRRFYSCVGNMVWLPTPLKGFTDAVPEIKKILRCCAFHLYDWACEHPDVSEQAAIVRGGIVPDYYPATWPTAGKKQFPVGTAPITAHARESVGKTKREISRCLNDASLLHYPRNEVREVLSFWKIDIGSKSR